MFEANYFSQENALKLRQVRKYLLALYMEDITSNVDGQFICSGRKSYYALQGRCGHSAAFWSCEGIAVSYHWIILVLALGSAQPRPLAATVCRQHFRDE